MPPTAAETIIPREIPSADSAPELLKVVGTVERKLVFPGVATKQSS
jgi:hypothetical protein